MFKAYSSQRAANTLHEKTGSLLSGRPSAEKDMVVRVFRSSTYAAQPPATPDDAAQQLPCEIPLSPSINALFLGPN